MGHLVRCPRKALPTELAGVGLLASVGPLVNGKVRWAEEAPLADAAREGLPHCVHFLVEDQVVLVAVPVRAQLAGKGLDTTVLPFMGY